MSWFLLAVTIGAMVAAIVAMLSARASHRAAASMRGNYWRGLDAGARFAVHSFLDAGVVITDAHVDALREQLGALRVSTSAEHHDER